MRRLDLLHEAVGSDVEAAHRGGVELRRPHGTLLEVEVGELVALDVGVGQVFAVDAGVVDVFAVEGAVFPVEELVVVVAQADAAQAARAGVGVDELVHLVLLEAGQIGELVRPPVLVEAAERGVGEHDAVVFGGVRLAKELRDLGCVVIEGEVAALLHLLVGA